MNIWVRSLTLNDLVCAMLVSLDRSLLLTSTAPIKTIILVRIINPHLKLDNTWDAIPATITEHSWIVSSGNDISVACLSEYPSPVRTILSNYMRQIRFLCVIMGIVEGLTDVRAPPGMHCNRTMAHNIQAWGSVRASLTWETLYRRFSIPVWFLIT